MVCRKCPKCGIVRYSANTQDWVCEECGSIVTFENEISMGGKGNGHREGFSKQDNYGERYKDSNKE